ncbi:hypothetical protein BpHYR1_034817 [Brachionus plicatilis]|uniref:Uncharacterized protein n=1 Tax=Brachionus plicatilis TaxID=10195 RepID=A0A3M7S8R8_BRAPC|nr:hypothetical protein BpHYR1_034817 [Brachionus plicatilis]
MIKKNKVIELYTKGERCVRKLSQLTGVPLTTVYRVIGKLKGINYNIPRGNGAGRKTILDAQDRECLVEILNKQPRISRKALGKELEKLTGKSIHNSTLNRELCRLRYQNTSGQHQQDVCATKTKRTKKFDELNEECSRMIASETKRFGSQMSQSEFECRPLSSALSANLSKKIIEICQMSTNLSHNSSQQLQQLKVDKIREALGELLSLGDSFYDRCLYETSVELCVHKPTLLTRQDDLVGYAKRILDNLQIVDDLKSKLKRAAASNLEQQSLKRAKPDEPPSATAPFNFYTAALALHLQQGQTFDFNSYLSKLRINLYQSQQDSLRSLIEKNEAEIKANLRQQEELRTKLFGLSMSSVSGEQLRPVCQSLQSQLGELIKQHAHLLGEQARLNSHHLSSQSDRVRKVSENDDANSQTMNDSYIFEAYSITRTAVGLYLKLQCRFDKWISVNLPTARLACGGAY